VLEIQLYVSLSSQSVIKKILNPAYGSRLTAAKFTGKSQNAQAHTIGCLNVGVFAATGAHGMHCTSASVFASVLSVWRKPPGIPRVRSKLKAIGETILNGCMVAFPG
jgi:hypothetical protein